MSDDILRTLETLRRKIAEGERGGSDADREALLEFSDRMMLLNSVYTDYRHEKLLRHCTRMSEECGGLAESMADREAAEEIVRWINRTYSNEETNSDYRTALRVFGRRVAEERGIEIDNGDPPDSIAWVPSGTSKSYDPAPDPADMIEWSEVKEMADFAPNPRDAALVTLQFDAGLRSGELQSLTVGDITDGEYGLQVRVDGKTGQRSVTLVPSVPFVKKWRYEAHPRSNDPDAPLWCKLDDGEELSYRRFNDIFKTMCRRIDLAKPSTATNFRKSNASWLARQGASSHLIEDRQGRSRGSKAVARYVARFGDSEGRRYAALHGRPVDSGPDAADIDPPTCPRCGEETPADEPACVWCGQAMAPGAAEAAERVRTELQKAMARSDSAEERSALLSALQEIDTNPEAASSIIQEALNRHSGTSP